MKKPLLITLLISAFSVSASQLSAQAVAAKTTTVMVNDAGVVVWPTAGLNYVQRVTDSQRIYGTAVGGVPYTFPYSSLATANTIAMRDINGNLKVGNPGADSSAATPKSYVDARTPQPVAARITIQLKPGETDGELKLATDNYVSGVLILWVHTPDPKGTIITGQIVPAGTRVYYTDSGYNDSRTQRALNWNTNSGIAYQKTVSGQVGSITFIVPVSAVIRPDNPALSWVYHCMTAADHEKDASGHAVWRIPTVEWITVLPGY